MIYFKQIYYIRFKDDIFDYQAPRHNGPSWLDFDYETNLLVKQAIAWGTCCVEAQVKLAVDTYECVRQYLALNPNLLPELQHKLAVDTHEWVRTELAKNPNLIAEVQHKLAVDAIWEVRHRLIKNPNLIPELKWKINI